MSGTSPANSSVSTTAVLGGGGGSGGGSSSNVGLSTDELYFPSELISIQDLKDEALTGELSQLIFILPFLTIPIIVLVIG